MKYEYYPKRRTEQERRELNEQIIRLLQSEACEQAGVTDEDIFNRYTGDGGLHGLRRSDYENYNAFSAAKKELENGGAAGFSGFSYTNTKYICNIDRVPSLRKEPYVWHLDDFRAGLEFEINGLEIPGSLYLSLIHI